MPAKYSAQRRLSSLIGSQSTKAKLSRAVKKASSGMSTKQVREFARSVSPSAKRQRALMRGKS